MGPDGWPATPCSSAQVTIGDETVRYVANINKYYLTYRLSQALLDERAPFPLLPSLFPEFA